MSRPSLDALLIYLARPACEASLTGLSKDPRSSCFGAVRVAAPKEQWPSHDGKPMWPLCQVNTRELPVKPPQLADIAMLRVWVARDYAELDDASAVCIRTDRSLTNLRPVVAPKVRGGPRPHGIRWTVIQDLPSSYDLPNSLEYDFSPGAGLIKSAAARDCPTSPKTKVGGYPYPLQGPGVHRATPYAIPESDFVLQIGSESKAKWMWGDDGVAFIGRGRVDRSKWSLYWECC